MIGNSFSYTGNFVFFGLAPSTEYEVIIQSRNREGWSDATDIFRFNTRSQGNSFTRMTFKSTWEHNKYSSNKLTLILCYFHIILDFNPLEQPYQHQGYFSGSYTSTLSSTLAVAAIWLSLFIVTF